MFIFIRDKTIFMIYWLTLNTYNFHLQAERVFAIIFNECRILFYLKKIYNVESII